MRIQHNPGRYIAAALMLFLSVCAAAEVPAIHAAARDNRPEFVREWIGQGKKVDAVYDESRLFVLHGSGSKLVGITPLMFAARARHFEIVKMLVDAKADLYRYSNWASGGGEKTVFDYAAEGGDFRVISYIWNAADEARMQPQLARNAATLMKHACDEQDTQAGKEFTQVLLIKLQPGDLSNAVTYLAHNSKCYKLVRAIKQHGVAPPPVALARAAMSGNGTLIHDYLRDGGNANVLVPYNKSRLMAFSFSDQLTESNQSAESKANDIMSPLIVIAARSGHYRIMKSLAAHQANVNLTDANGQSALMAVMAEDKCKWTPPGNRDDPWDCNRFLYDFVEFLLKRGARKDLKDNAGKTAMDYLNARSDEFGVKRLHHLMSK